MICTIEQRICCGISVLKQGSFCGSKLCQFCWIRHFLHDAQTFFLQDAEVCYQSVQNWGTPKKKTWATICILFVCWSELCSFYNIFASSSLLHFGGALIDDERVAGSSSANCKRDDRFCKVPTLCADACLCTQISSVQWRDVSRSFVCGGSKLMWFRNWQTLKPVCWLWIIFLSSQLSDSKSMRKTCSISIE